MRFLKKLFRKLGKDYRSYALVEKSKKNSPMMLLYSIADMTDEEALERNTVLLCKDMDVEWIYWGD